MILDIILALIGILAVFGIVVAQRGLYYSTIVRYSVLCPNHPKLPAADAFVKSFGGMAKVDSAARTGIEVSLIVMIAAAVALAVRHAETLRTVL